ncbi:MAG: hypothetical protein M1827_007267 [Pycnora praestabilis]|nr:MAG: hypothetical protein M1827_007267 [Pycnora praestabilis]
MSAATLAPVNVDPLVTFPLEKEQGGGIEKKSDEEAWTADTWRLKHVAQDFVYADGEKLEAALKRLHSLPPLVSPKQIEDSRKQLALVADGKAFIMQGGDCAESFDDVQMDIIASKVELLSNQSMVLSRGLGMPVIQIGRLAGQYAKPRSNPLETLADGRVVPAFRGHNINSTGLDGREPDPQRLLLGYFHAATTLNTLNVLEDDPGRDPNTPHNLYTSHEALHLPYESAVTKGEYNLSATCIWIGERTRQLDGAHVEYLRGLRNPIGVKIGPKFDTVDLVELLDMLNPAKSPGRMTLITRLGAGNVESVLPKFVEAVVASGHRPLWLCDPCHGNTITVGKNIKTRRVETILDEVTRTYTVHRRLGTHLGGLHLEQTGEDVTECLGGGGVNEEMALSPNYKSLCDPRLSGEQALTVVKGFVEVVIASNGVRRGSFIP